MVDALMMKREGLEKERWVDSKASQWGAEDAV